MTYLPTISPLCIGYIGPGAGFAFLGSFLILLAAVALALGLLLTLPLRLLFGIFFRRSRRKGVFKRCVVLGFDGMDPRRARRLIDQGALPHLARLERVGVFSELGSTCPPISPVAWSSFSTSVNPGKHNIFDFLNRDIRTYLPELSSSRALTRIKRSGLFGKRETGEVQLLRKSKPFWKVLGEYGVEATVLRVPITFPCESFAGRALAAMCTPDLRGTQGEFTLLESADDSGAGNPDESSSSDGLEGVGGRRIAVEPHRDGSFRCNLPGPVIGDRTLAVRVEIRPLDANRAELKLDGKRHDLCLGRYTEWLPLVFKDGRRRVHGICRMLPLAFTPRPRIYITPLNIDPEHPAMPISHPSAYSIYLAKRFGPFATLGLAEDTWALTEGILDEDQFLRQCYDIHDERERMFLDALDHTRRGFCACVFDLTDRVQHMFYRFEEKDHPARRPGDDPDGRFAAVIDASYKRCDRLVGEVMQRLNDDSLLMVISDHGFGSFRRGVNLNAWLLREGYLFVREDVPPAGPVARGESGNSQDGSVPVSPDADYLQTVDWRRTRAYSFGLSGIYLNLAGREGQGIVEPGAPADALRTEIADRLSGLCDPRDGKSAVKKVHSAPLTYSGPYRERGPDLVVGLRRGYRMSWENAVGRTDGEIFTDNRKAWSGDHCVDRGEVPGVLFSNRRLRPGKRPPHLADIGPTLLNLWDIPVPAYMDGKTLDIERPPSAQTR